LRLLRTAAAASALALALTALTATAATAESEVAKEYVVLFASGTDSATARAAVEAAGGTVVSENTDIGVATVTTTNEDFAAAADAQAVIEGTAGNRIIAAVPNAGEAETKKFDAVEDGIREAAGSLSVSAQAKAAPAAPGAEPLAALQWDMQAIGATVDGSYKYEQGDKRVVVGVMDTGVDGAHPDIAPNFDAAASRNFTVDIPFDANGAVIDGPCEEEPDQSCHDPADVDEDGHGTHVASTIGSPLNGIGIAGVAPKVTLVNLRAGQDSGYFFLQPTVDALTYAGKTGVDVVNMSFYVDPWLFNCTNHPADSPEDQAEQRTIVTAVQRGLDFARNRGVALVAAAGNGASDYTKVIQDASSPDFADVPGEAPYVRELLDPASCTSMPSEGRGVISVTSTGPSGRKAYYSNYGNGYADVSAPGGDAYDTPTNELDPAAVILAAYPQSLAEANGDIDENGEPTTPFVVKSCTADGATCAYYQYLQGTSMASPHAAGVAALIVSKYGVRDVFRGGRYLPAQVTEQILLRTAVNTACPTPREYTYTRVVVDAEGNSVTRVSTATCEGGGSKNGFYGDGVVNALRAIGRY